MLRLGQGRETIKVCNYIETEEIDIILTMKAQKYLTTLVMSLAPCSAPILLEGLLAMIASA